MFAKPATTIAYDHSECSISCSDIASTVEVRAYGEPAGMMIVARSALIVSILSRRDGVILV